MTPVGRRDQVVIVQRAYGTSRNSLLSQIQVRGSDQSSFLEEQTLDSFLEPPDLDHPSEHL
jgi:hypothetical protein